METNIEKLKEYLGKRVSEKRLSHSIGVMNMCERLAHIHNSDITRAKLAGLMHDMAKELTKEEKLNYVKENEIKHNKYEEKFVDILHGKIAADMCKKLYKFDEEMCIAIAYHTTGKENMSLLEKIVFIADKIDETRNYEGIDELRELAYKDLNSAILKNIDKEIARKLEEKKWISEESLKTRNYLLLNSEK